MIPRDYITSWRVHAPWATDAQVEQDLVISRALVELFRVPNLASALAFRGGTALYKLHLTPPPRYSEDIDLVQVGAEPIGDTLNLMRPVLDPWLGPPRWKLKEEGVNLLYRFESEDQPPLRLRLKIEINTREHFTELGLQRVPLDVDSRWFGGSAGVTTYTLDELLGTKLRALYQRKKGRDLFDLWHALDTGRVDVPRVIACFLRYMAEGGHSATRAQFEENMEGKRGLPDFREDMGPLLRPGLLWDVDVAMNTVLERIIAFLPGDPWKGLSQPH
ncbi:MAG: nucleotidyl transferase AbiEii/AbiGii toxin family protein [Gammaproteobacteria bacterium]|nr:nucleotidyl transferase AbiEii/AbiGii toxin family protein [Gammaproteobacteria bacterium]MDE0256974.1 nucleotidyl transferase AbiEii/AbiGii toxin family protein [Gammaproteobacteria bacterium]